MPKVKVPKRTALQEGLGRPLVLRNHPNQSCWNISSASAYRHAETRGSDFRDVVVRDSVSMTAERDGFRSRQLIPGALAWLRHYTRPRFLHHFPGVSEDWFCSLSGSPEDVTSMPTYRVVDESLGKLESHSSIVVAFLLGDRGTCFYEGLKGSNRDYRLRLAFLCLIATVVMRGTIRHYSLSSGGRISVGLPVSNTLKSAFCDSERRYCDTMFG